MNWPPTIFTTANLFALLAWILLIFGPRREVVFTVLRDGVVGLLSMFYAILLIYLMLIAPAPAGDGPNFTTIEGVRTIFATDIGLTLGWVHYLAFDLFVGLWVARDADEIALSRFVQVPILLATFLFGPIGLCIYLVIRRIHGARKTA